MIQMRKFIRNILFLFRDCLEINFNESLLFIRKNKEEREENDKNINQMLKI